MGLIGSSFLSHLVTPPPLWPDQEVPVYVIPDTVQLSEVHNLRLNELGLAIGIPFQVSQSNPNERPQAKVMESEAIRSLFTLVEDSVELRESTNPKVAEGVDSACTPSVPPPDSLPTTPGTSNQMVLCFAYSAVDDFELKIEIYAKLSSNLQKMSMDRVGVSLDPIVVPAGMKARFDSSKFGIHIDLKQLPGVAARTKKMKPAVFDLVLIASPVSPGGVSSSNNHSNSSSSNLYALPSGNKPDGSLHDGGGSVDGRDDQDIPLSSPTPADTEPLHENLNTDQLVIVGRPRTNWTSPWKSAAGSKKTATSIYPSALLMRSKPSGSNLLAAAMENSKLFWLRDAGYSQLAVLKEAYFFRCNAVAVENFMLHRKLQREAVRTTRRNSVRRASVGNVTGGKHKVNPAKQLEGAGAAGEFSPRRASMSAVPSKSSVSHAGKRPSRKKVGNKSNGTEFQELPTTDEMAALPVISVAEGEQQPSADDAANSPSEQPPARKDSPVRMHKGSRVESMSLEELSDDSEVDLVKKDIDDIISEYQKQRQQSSADHSGSKEEMRCGSEVSSVDHNLSPRGTNHRASSSSNMIVDMLVPSSLKKVVSSKPATNVPVTPSEQRSPPIKLDLMQHKYEMNKGVYDSMAIYGADSKLVQLEKLFQHRADIVLPNQAEERDDKAPAETTEDGDNMCVVCLSSEKEVVLYPCRHCNMCIDCGKMISDQGRKCPVCRQLVTLLIHLH